RGVATERRHRLQREVAIDTLGDDAHLKRSCELDDHLHDLSVLLVRRRGGDESSVDLHLGRRNLLEIRERRIAFAEVVDRQAYAELAHALEAGRRRGIAANEALLRQLDDEPDLCGLELFAQLAETREEVGVR